MEVLEVHGAIQPPDAQCRLATRIRTLERCVHRTLEPVEPVEPWTVPSTPPLDHSQATGTTAGSAHGSHFKVRTIMLLPFFN